MTKRNIWQRRAVIAIISCGVSACALTTHPVERGALGIVRPSSAMEQSLEQPGPITVETVVSADWQVPLSGLINLKNPEAAGLKDHDEPIKVFVHVLKHPERGTYLVDTGIERALARDPSHSDFGALVRAGAHTDKMVVHEDAASIVARSAPVAGVLLTHVHLDHIAGLPDVPADVPVYAGPGDTGGRELMSALLQGTVNALFADKGPIREWPFAADSDGRFAGVLDVFGDGSLWAIHSPGHTPGNTAYLVRTPKGPVLLTGDTCHTRWGWEHGVEPGTFSADVAASKASFAALRALVARHPTVDVRLGHQFLNEPATARTAP